MLHGTLSSESKAPPQFFPFGEEQIYPLMFCMMVMMVVNMIIVNVVIVNTVNMMMMMMIEMLHILQMMLPFGSHR